MAKSSLSNKVAVSSGKPMATKFQPVVGKLKNGTESMPGSSGKGQHIKTVPSNKPQGPAKRDTAMGNGGVIDPFC